MKNILLKKKSKIIFIVAGLYLLHATNAQSQVLDETFGKGGLVTTNVTSTGYEYAPNAISNLALQEDGKIVAVGNLAGNIQLVRYQSNGNLDSSFGHNGIILTNFSEQLGGEAYGITVNVLEDNKILVGGYFNAVDAKYHQLLIRYKTNGELDSSFGINGKVIGFEGRGISVAVQKDGKILVTGDYGVIVSGLYRVQFSVVRYQSNGLIDSSFGKDGRAIIVYDQLYHSDFSNVVYVQDDQKILLAGSTVVSGIIFPLLTRIKTDGTLDSSFGYKGKVAAYFDQQTYVYGQYGVRAIIVQRDGKIVTEVFGESRGFLKYNSDGSLDAAFGVNGKVYLGYSIPYSNDGPHSILFQRDEKILRCGYDFNNFNIMRYTNNGTIDSSFGLNGLMIINFGNTSRSIAYCMALQQDGKILTAGYVFPMGAPSDFALARFIPDGTLAIAWKDFTAIKKEKTVLLNWQTANENNSAYFSVERSANGSNNFYAIGKVPGKGNSAQVQPYVFEDINPLKGRNYYRLKQVDADGHFSYSKILLVDFENIAAIKLYPNPVKDILRIEGLNSTGATSLAIVDLSGRVMAKAVTENSNNYSWNIKQLTAGVYYLIISAGKEKTSHKFIKE